MGGSVDHWLDRRLARVPVRARNVFELIVRDAIRNWARNRRTLTPALGSMAVLLLLAGLGGLGALAVGNVVAQESQQASVLHVYLKDGATDFEVSSLEQRLRADPRVASVGYVSKDQALQQVRSRPGLAALVQQSTDNPLPASLTVQVRNLAAVPAMARLAGADPAADPTYPSSYDADVYSGLQSFVHVAGVAVTALIAVLAAVSALVTANAIRAGIVARWDDLAIMRLVGASGWMVRGPFVIEGAVTGALAGVIGGAGLCLIFLALQRAGSSAFTDILPGVGWAAAAACATAILFAGTALGSTASLIGLRGLRA